MLCQVKRYKKDQSEQYQKYQQFETSFENSDNNEKVIYKFTFVQKQRSFFSPTPLILVMKSIWKPPRKLVKFFIQNEVEIRQNEVIPRCQDRNQINPKNIQLRKCSISLAYLSKKSSFQELHLMFINQQIAKQWMKNLTFKEEPAAVQRQQQPSSNLQQIKILIQRLKKQELENLEKYIGSKLNMGMRERQSIRTSVQQQQAYISFLTEKVIEQSETICKMKKNPSFPISQQYQQFNNEQDVYQSFRQLHLPNNE